MSKEKLVIGDYIINTWMPYKEKKKNTIWITNKLEEGMELDLDKLWKKEF
jgi:hypothetical protein